MSYNGNGKVEIGLRLIFLQQLFEQSVGKDIRRAISLEKIKDFYNDKLGVRPSTNTVYNDLSLLKDVFNMDIQYIQRHGYILTNPRFEAYELRLIIDCLQSSKFITKKEADSISKKVKDNFADEQTRRTLNRDAIVADRVKSMNDSVVKGADNIYEAIAQDRKIAFRYFHRMPDRNKSRKYTKAGDTVIVSPYALLWDSGNYYLYAYLSETKKFKTFRVDRMDNISAPLLEPREGKKEYHSKDIISSAVVFDAYKTDKVYSVAFRCHNRVADAVIDRFGEDVKLKAEGENHFSFNAVISLSPPFYAWVATFGKMMKITAPAEAVEGMKAFLQKSLEMYQS